ncbi:MAG: GDSL-type esterase/lipase family protein [Acidobacteriota bacterium]|nr:GDSL-type esterase/lipase family protein [Acidobacteriota bacterium]
MRGRQIIKITSLVILLVVVPPAFAAASAPLVSIQVTPANPCVPQGGTQQFTARGTYADRSTQDLTSAVTWTSSTLGQLPTTGVCFIGDSIINHLGALNQWHGAVANNWVNAGVGGDASFSVLARINNEIDEPVCHTAVILVGINDLAGCAGCGHQCEDVVPPGTAANGYTSVASYIQQSVQVLMGKGVRPVVGTLMPVTSAWVNPTPALGDKDVVNAKILQLNAWLRSYAKSQGIVIADYYPLFAGPDGYGVARLYNVDGLHPNASGNLVLATQSGIALELMSPPSAIAGPTETIMSGGLATGVAQGITSIRATLGAISGSTTLTVTPPPLVPIAVMTTLPSISLGGTK